MPDWVEEDVMEVSSEKSKKKAAGLESSESETLNKSSENTFASASASALDGDPSSRTIHRVLLRLRIFMTTT